MHGKRFWRRMAIVASMALGLSLFAPSANASLWTGGCVLSLQFNFATPIRSALGPVSMPSYGIAVSAGQDLNPTTQAQEACAITLDALNPFRTTSVIANGTSDVWTCEAARGAGQWDQSWGISPPPISGFYSLNGTWGNWVMLITATAFTGVVHLSVHPNDASKLAQCETSGITSLRTIGVMTFQDP